MQHYFPEVADAVVKYQFCFTAATISYFEYECSSQTGTHGGF